MTPDATRIHEEDRATPSDDHRPGPSPRRHTEAVHTAADLLALGEPEPLRWTVAMLAYRGGLTILAAPGESGKSTLALHTAAAVAAGTPIADLAVEHGAALYVDAEGRDKIMRRRLGKMLTPATRDLHICFPHRRDPLDLTSDTGLARLEDRIVSLGATHVVLDSLTRLSGDTEDTTVEMGRTVGALADLASDLDVAVVVVHHSNRGGSWRGHSSVRDQADLLYVTKPGSTARAMRLYADKFRERDDLPWHELHLGIATVEDRTTIIGPGVVFPKGEEPKVAPALDVVLRWVEDAEVDVIDRKTVAAVLDANPTGKRVEGVLDELRARGWEQAKQGRRNVLRAPAA